MEELSQKYEFVFQHKKQWKIVVIMNNNIYRKKKVIL
jgi:hypothetical protein